MLDEQKMIELIEQVVKGFPNLVVLRSKGGVEVKYTAASSPEDSAALVGNYTFSAVARGEISERDIREDCEAFFLSLKLSEK